MAAHLSEERATSLRKEQLETSLIDGKWSILDDLATGEALTKNPKQLDEREGAGDGIAKESLASVHVHLHSRPLPVHAGRPPSMCPSAPSAPSAPSGTPFLFGPAFPRPARSCRPDVLPLQQPLRPLHQVTRSNFPKGTPSPLLIYISSPPPLHHPHITTTHQAVPQTIESTHQRRSVLTNLNQPQPTSTNLNPPQSHIAVPEPLQTPYTLTPTLQQHQFHQESVSLSPPNAVKPPPPPHHQPFCDALPHHPRLFMVSIAESNINSLYGQCSTLESLLTRSHKYNDRDHAGLADGTASPQEHLPRYFAKHGHEGVDPKKVKKNGGGRSNWGNAGEEVIDEDFRFTNARRRTNSSGFADNIGAFKTKFDVNEPEPVFEESIHGPSEEDGEDLTKTESSESGRSSAYGDEKITKH
ncbi:hypothetical protein CCUS01_14733 [Colletotrichum cuscutae]|uniref:Hyaluronan/mRNA-binding protein domain-containing protein n=1 Tax=Colletotrichum cuscutae TaxID=1209917 RepID=A0AAI9Y862_9PEZI|nr:hypothetical protein CCUS01_14733 [Colletotrichum cuscutae]